MGAWQISSVWRGTLIFVIGLSVVSPVVGQVPRQVLTTCFKDYVNKELVFNVGVIENDETILYAYPFDDNNCAESTQRLLTECPFSGSATVDDPLGISVTMTIPWNFVDDEPDLTGVSTQQSPGFCAVQYSGGVYTMVLMTRMNPDLTVQTYVDHCHTVSCSLDEAFPIDTIAANNGDPNPYSVSGDFPITRLMSPSYRVEMHVKHPDHSIMTNAEVGDFAYLQLEFYPGFYPTGPDTNGRSFHFGFIEGKTGSGDNDYGNQIDVHLLISTTSSLTRGATVVIESNLLDSSPKEETIPSNSMVDVLLVLNDRIIDGSFKITSDQEISVVAVQRRSGSVGSFTVMPDDTLGTRYYGAFWNANGDRIKIVATQDATTAYLHVPDIDGVKVRYNGVDYKELELITMPLANENDYVNIVSSNRDITGCLIYADKPIAVVTGNRRTEIPNKEDDHVTMQLPQQTSLGSPSSTLNGGRNRYIFMAYPTLGNRNTYYKVISASAEVNTVDWYDSVGGVLTNLNIFIQEGMEYIEFDIPTGTAHEIVSDEPILLLQFTPTADKNHHVFDGTASYIPPVPQWAGRYQLPVIDDYTTDHMLVIAVERSHMNDIRLDGFQLAGVVWEDVIDAQNTAPGTSEFVWTAHSQYFAPGLHSLEIPSDYSATFYAAFYSQSNANEQFMDNFLLPGTRLSDLENCVAGGFDGDINDNDCDGLIDEELRDGIDNDLDGLTDEDLAAIIDDVGKAVAIRAVDCWVSANSDFTDPKRPIVNVDGCLPAAWEDLAFFLEGGNFERVTDYGEEPVIYRTGQFRIARFDEGDLSPKTIYYGCHIELCSDWNDATCDNFMCTGGTTGLSRRKREAANHTIEFTAVSGIYVGDSRSTNAATQQKPDPVASCMAVTTFVTVAIVLALLFLLSVVIVTYLLSKLKRSS